MFSKLIRTLALAALLPASSLAATVVVWNGDPAGVGFNDPTPEQFAFAVTLSRITIPYLALISLVSLLGGILNSLDRFAAVAATPRSWRSSPAGSTSRWVRPTCSRWSPSGWSSAAPTSPRWLRS